MKYSSEDINDLISEVCMTSSEDGADDVFGHYAACPYACESRGGEDDWC